MAGCGSESKEVLLVGSKVKAYVKSKGLMSSAEVLDALNGCLYDCLDRAMERAKANGRRTLQARDV